MEAHSPTNGGPALPPRRHHPFPYIIWWAIAVHSIWGLALVADPSLSAFVILIGMDGISALTGLSGATLGCVLLSAASVAAASLVLAPMLSSRVALALLMPQYLLVITAVLSDSIAIATGRAGATPVSSVLLLAALCPVIVAGALHSVAIIERHLKWSR